VALRPGLVASRLSSGGIGVDRPWKRLYRQFTQVRRLRKGLPEDQGAMDLAGDRLRVEPDHEVV